MKREAGAAGEASWWRRCWSLGGGAARGGGGCGARKRGWGLFIAAGRRWGGSSAAVAGWCCPASGAGRLNGVYVASRQRGRRGRGEVTARQRAATWGRGRALCGTGASGESGASTAAGTASARRGPRRCVSRRGQARTWPSRGGGFAGACARATASCAALRGGAGRVSGERRGGARVEQGRAGPGWRDERGLGAA
ncbi:hypothetical protein PVAP13_8KG324006 [Panicum virgatum]|uniref:Uncharacterized protein n=1 Tax=Panicum virgatum TaxID=38727 RepID=A0A8T0PPN2_PANVG|nr:hypothetical protein PVAP13_8KG324006 [Panicum virgatum]